jgi:hypothetical protein
MRFSVTPAAQLLCSSLLINAVHCVPDSCGTLLSVEGVDQSPTSPQQYGKCTAAVDARILNTSNWCMAPSFNSWPSVPTAEASACLKFGRLSVYTGPVCRESLRQLRPQALRALSLTCARRQAEANH